MNFKEKPPKIEDNDDLSSENFRGCLFCHLRRILLFAGACSLSTGKIKLLEFIEALGPTISTKDPLVRAKSVRLLSLTLGRLAIDAALLDAEIRHLFYFLLARIEDHHLVAPAALLGLRALTASTRYK